MKRIPVSGPSITQREIDYVSDAVANGWYENANVYQRRFEQAFAARVNRPARGALPSCTSGLHLALAALGIGPGDEVIVPESTWIASAAPIDYVGATAVFADVDPVTWCLSRHGVPRRWSPRRARAPILGRPLRRHAGQDGAASDRAAPPASRSSRTRRRRSARATAAAWPAASARVGVQLPRLQDADDRRRRHARDRRRRRWRVLSVLRDHGRGPGDVSFFNHEIGQVQDGVTCRRRSAWRSSSGSTSWWAEAGDLRVV